MFTIINTPLVALYAEPEAGSTTLSQLLFGEQIEIIEKQDEWLFVKNLQDESSGWIHRFAINPRLFVDKKADTSQFAINKSPAMICFKTSSVEKITLPGGSLIPPVNNDKFELLGEIYQIAQYLPGASKAKNGALVVELAQEYINAPYLQGGKTLFGIDSDGLVQLSYAMMGISLPRFAAEQVEAGEVVDFLTEVEAGDLAFFENEEGEIIHCGILINSHQIIHASGYVKKEIVDAQGIISSATGEYSHKLRVIKRVIG